MLKTHIWPIFKNKNIICIILISQKNSIPVYSPALTDGSLGDMMYFHSYRKPGLIVDILEGNELYF
jgi:deoxyhypusine synthase